MSAIKIATNFNIEIDFEAPPFHRRLFAWLLDIIVLLLYIFVAGKMISLFFRSGGSQNDGMKEWAIGLLFILPLFTYHLICELLMNGQSIGKKILGIRVIAENGGRPSISQFVIRWLIRTSDYALLLMALMIPIAEQFGSQIYVAFGGSMLLLLTDVVLVNSKKGQRLGDILAHTFLINTKQKEDINDTVFLEVEKTYVPSFPQVMRLSDRDINALKGILDTSRKRHDYHMAEMASNKIKAHLQIDTPLSPFDFLEVLLKDYNYLSAN